MNGLFNKKKKSRKNSNVSAGTRMQTYKSLYTQEYKHQ